MWRCPKCETLNDGKFCGICGTSEADAIAAAQVQEPPVQQVPVQQAPVQQVPVQQAPVYEQPVVPPTHAPATPPPYGYGAPVPPTHAPVTPPPYGYGAPVPRVRRGMSGLMIATLGIFIFATISYIFMPIMEVPSYFGWQKLVVAKNFGNLIENMFNSLADFSLVLILIACVAGVVGACLRKKGIAIIGAVLGLAGACMLLYETIDMLPESFSVTDVIGPGVWVAAVSFIVAFITAVKSED